MKKILHLGLIGLCVAPMSFALPPVELSDPSPAISSSYTTGTSTTVVYTITNNTPNVLELIVSGVSDPISVTSTTNNCAELLQGPSTCNIALTIAPSSAQAGMNVDQTLQINYGGREPLTDNIAFQVAAAPTSQFGYVASYNNTPTSPDSASIYYCEIGTAGVFQNCNLATAVTNSFNEINFGTVNSTTYAYVTANGSGIVYQCGLNTDGSFSGCNPTPSSGAPTWTPINVVLATVQTNSGPTQFAYVANTGGEAYQCTLNTDGSFNTCTAMASNSSIAWVTNAIALATVQGTQYAYVANVNSVPNVIEQCTLSSTDGTLDICNTLMTPPSGWDPVSIVFNTVSGVQYAYVSDSSSSVIYQCTLNLDGTFSACNPTPSSGAPAWLPYQIAFKSVSGVDYVYVTDPIGLKVYICTVNSDGTFSSCAITPASGAPSWAPVGIATD